MKRSIACLALAFALTGSCSFDRQSDLPGKWKKEFSIRAYSGGGMRNEATEVEFTYDSCRYVYRTGAEREIISFPQTEASRIMILAKMHELQLAEIRTSATGITYDKESTGICYNYKNENHCSEEGATSEIDEEDEANFFSAYQYLLDFAKRKGSL